MLRATGSLGEHGNMGQDQRGQAKPSQYTERHAAATCINMLPPLGIIQSNSTVMLTREERTALRLARPLQRRLFALLLRRWPYQQPALPRPTVPLQLLTCPVGRAYEVQKGATIRYTRQCLRLVRMICVFARQIYTGLSGETYLTGV
jgi:hypothetical protein